MDALGVRHLVLATLFLGLGVAPPAAADLPAVTVGLDTSVVSLGDRVGIHLELRYGTEHEPLTPDVELWLEGLSPRPARANDTQSGTAVRVRTYDTDIQLFKLGSHSIPPLDVNFITAGGDTLVRTTREGAVEAVSVRQEGDQEPRDIKPPVRVPGGLPLWAVLCALVLMLVAAGVVLYRWMMGRDRPAPVEPPPAPVDYAAEFVRIAGMGLVDRGEYKKYYSLLADNLRRYLEQSLCIEAMEQTTEEIAHALGRERLDCELAAALRNYFDAADLVKFARQTPDLAAARRVPEAGMALIQRTDRFVSQRRAAEAEAARMAAELDAHDSGQRPLPVDAPGDGRADAAVEPTEDAALGEASVGTTPPTTVSEK
jgi:hypothetical protein